MALMSLSACPPRDFGIEYVAPMERAIGGNRSTGKLLDRLPGINVEKQILLGGIMGCGPWDFCVDVKRTRRPAPGGVVTRGSNSGNNVIRLEKLRTSIICGQQGEKRQREQKSNSRDKLSRAWRAVFPLLILQCNMAAETVGSGTGARAMGRPPSAPR